MNSQLTIQLRSIPSPKHCPLIKFGDRSFFVWLKNINYVKGNSTRQNLILWVWTIKKIGFKISNRLILSISARLRACLKSQALSARPNLFVLWEDVSISQLSFWKKSQIRSIAHANHCCCGLKTVQREFPNWLRNPVLQKFINSPGALNRNSTAAQINSLNFFE